MRITKLSLTAKTFLVAGLAYGVVGELLSACVPRAELEGCNKKDDSNPAYNWYRFIEYTIECKATPGCENSDLVYEWWIRTQQEEMVEFPEYGEPRLPLPEFLLEFGKHVLSIHVTEIPKGGRKKRTVVKTCYLRIVPSTPGAVISGGSLRAVLANMDHRVDGRESINHDCGPEEEFCLLKYRWSCKSTNPPANEYCEEKVSKTKRGYFIMPKELNTVDSTLDVTLQVSATGKEWVPTEQTLKFYENIKQSVRIRCVKNCPPVKSVTSPLLGVLMKLVCERGCTVVDFSLYRWTIKSSGEQLKSENPEFGFLPADKLTPGATVVVQVQRENMVMGEFSVIPASLPQCGSINVDPNSGSVTTMFQVVCKPKDEKPLEYYLYQDQKGVLLASSQSGIFKVLLSGPGSSAILSVKMRDPIINAYGSCQTTVKVESVVGQQASAESKIEALWNIYNSKTNPNSIFNLLLANKTQQAFQSINVAITEASLITGTEEAVEELKYNFTMTVLKDLFSFSLAGSPEIMQATSAIESILKFYQPQETDPQFTKLLSMVCKHVSKAFQKTVDDGGCRQYDDSKKISTSLSQCADVSLKPNEPIMELPVPTTTTTAQPMLTHNVLPEDYPEYQDLDDAYVTKLLDFEEGTTNALVTNKNAVAAVARSMEPGEPARIKNYSWFVMAAQVEKGKFMAGFRLNVSNTMSIQHSKDFGNVKQNVIECMAVGYNKNPFWWHKSSEVHTSVIEVAYKDRSRGWISSFKNPMKLELQRIVYQNLTFAQSNVTVPSNPASWNAKDIEMNMYVHVLKVPAMHGLGISFESISGGAILDFVILHEMRPVLDDFVKGNAITVSSDKKYVSLALNPKQDALYYMAVLPNKKMLSQTNELITVFYEAAFEIMTCARWITSDREWSNGACRIGVSDRNQIQCKCYHSSLFGGMYFNTKHRIEHIDTVSVVLGLHVSYVIYGTVCVVFALYCILLTCFTGKKELVENVYYLSDNLRKDLYAYLLIVRTKDKKNAGTTSNVCIRVSGTEYHSRVHVLNYPDPEKRLLQRGSEDWFVMSTTRHLGEIEKIKIWFDGIGNDSSWFCLNIDMYDLQEKRHWYFEVEQYFSVMPGGVSKCTVTPSSAVDNKEETGKVIKWIRLYKDALSKHTWNLVYEPDVESFCKLKKLTVVFSMIVTTYGVSLLFYGVPHFKLTDGISYYGHVFMHYTVVLIAIGSSIISFVLNFAVVYLFRHSQVQFPKENVIGNKVHKFNFKGTAAAWFLCGAIIVVSLTLLVVCGFWVPFVTSTLWLLSGIGALLQSAIILEHVYIYLENSLENTSKILKKAIGINYQRILKEVERQRQFLFKKFGDLLLRPFFGKVYRFLLDDDVLKKRMREIKRAEFFELIADLILFVIYMLLLYIVILSNRDPLLVKSHNQIESLIILAEFNRGMTLEDVALEEDLFTYINETVIPAIQSLHWYGTWYQSEPGLLADFSNKILGVATLRQHRVRDNAYRFSLNNAAYRSYDECWRRKTIPVEVRRTDEFWNFRDDGAAIIGDMHYYPPGGYMVPLGRTTTNIHINLEYLQTKNWISKETRAVFVEFLAYNVNYNVFNSISIVFERTAIGFYEKSYFIRTGRFLFTSSEVRSMILLVFSAFLIITLVILSKNLFKIYKTGKSYFKIMWNYVDAAIIAMSFACIILFLQRIGMILSFLRRVEQMKNNEHVSYSKLFFVEDLICVLGGILICIATVRLWKFLRFSPRFVVLEKTLLYAAIPLLALLFFHMLLVLAFANAGLVFFGLYSKGFRDVTSSVSTLVFHSLGLYPDFDFDTMTNQHSGFGIVYYISYMLLIMVIYSVYVTIIMIASEQSRTEFSNQTQYYTMQRYVRDVGSYYLELLRVRLKRDRLRGGTDQSTPRVRKIYPKALEHRYADCVTTTTTRMNAMATVAKTVVKTRYFPNEDIDYQLMAEVVSCLTVPHKLGESKDEIFIVSDDAKDVTLVDDYRLLQMEAVVESMLAVRSDQMCPVTLPKFDYIAESLEVVLDLISGINIV